MASLLRSCAFVLPCIASSIALAACNGSSGNTARRADPDSLAVEKSAKKRPPAWERESVPMPASFARFPATKLDTLVGTWLVASDIPGQRELWILEAEGRKLTLVDARGRERVYGLSLQSPCTLAITDDFGRTRTRRFTRVGDRLFTHPQGAAAVAGSDGSALVCVGSRTLVVPPEGPCVGFSEMLGVWSELGAPTDACVREPAAVVEGQPPAPADLASSGPDLVIGERRLRAVDGVWMDEVLQQALAEKVADRAAGERALAEAKAKPKPSEPATTSTTGAAETTGAP